jgi:hypothetical protein
MIISGKSKIIGLILFLSVLFAAWAGPHIYGDSVSYYMMASSLAKDGDFILGQRDAARWDKDGFEGVPVGAYVRRDDAGNMRYAKPVLFPMIAAPFFLVLGRPGLAILNGLLLGLCVVFPWLSLRRYTGSSVSFLIAFAFIGFSVIPAYAGWVTPDVFLFFCCSLCVFLLAEKKPMVCALVVGLIGGEKASFLLMLIPLAAFFAVKNEVKRLLMALGVCSLGIVFTVLLTGYCLKTFWAYSDPKYILFSGAIPRTLDEFQRRLALTPSELMDMRFNGPRIYFGNAINFLFGRFSGVLWYFFPAAVCSLIYFWRRNEIIDEERIQYDSFVLTAVLLSAVLLFFRPLNYFGGPGFFGNRYFFIYPALIFPPIFKTLRKPGLVLFLFLPAVLVSFQVLSDSLEMKNWHKSQWSAVHVSGFGAHTCTPPLRYAALEINAVENLPVYSRFFPGGLVLYAPQGLRNGSDGQAILGKGRETVFVLKGRRVDLELKTSSGEFVLRPVLVLVDKSNKELKSFFYFRPAEDLKLSGIGFKDI